MGYEFLALVLETENDLNYTAVLMIGVMLEAIDSIGYPSKEVESRKLRTGSVVL